MHHKDDEKRGKVIGVMVDGEPTFHARGVASDYDTLCGMDANDDHVGHEGYVTARRGQKITCSQCWQIWRETVALQLRESSFDVAAGK